MSSTQPGICRWINNHCSEYLYIIIVCALWSWPYESNCGGFSCLSLATPGLHRQRKAWSVCYLDYSSPKVDVFAWTKSFGLADSTDQIHDFFPNLTMPAWSMQTQPPPLPDISTPSICRLQNDSCSFFHVIPTLQKSGGKLNVCRSEIIWSRACKEFRVTFKSACRKSFLATRQLELVIKGMSNE